MQLLDGTALLLSMGIFLYGVRLMLLTPASSLFCFELEAGGRTFSFYFPKTIDPDTKQEVDRLITSITQARHIMLASHNPTEQEACYYHIKETLLLLAETAGIDRHTIVRLLHALDDEIEVMKMQSNLRRYDFS